MDAIESYLDHLTVERGASPNTVSGYRRDLARYRDFLISQGKTSLDEVFEADVEAFRSWLQTAHDDRPALAASSVTRAVIAVRGLHRFAAAERITSQDPAALVKPPKLGRSLPKALSVAQVQALIDAPDPSTAAGARDRALLELLYGTGARISEALSLDVDDVAAALDSDAPLRLFGKGRKERIVPLGSYAKAALSHWLALRPEFASRATRATPALFLNTRGGRLSRQSACAMLKDTAAMAGLPESVSPHTLRHSFATHLLDGGADIRVVQELLGHSSVTTTQIYTLVTVEHLREVYLTSHPRAY
jgi:integrase/recombinase XerD